MPARTKCAVEDTVILAESYFRFAVSTSLAVRYRRFGVRIPGQSNHSQCYQWLATTATFLRSCVAQELSREDGPRLSLYATA